MIECPTLCVYSSLDIVTARLSHAWTQQINHPHASLTNQGAMSGRHKQLLDILHNLQSLTVTFQQNQSRVNLTPVVVPSSAPLLA